MPTLVKWNGKYSLLFIRPMLCGIDFRRRLEPPLKWLWDGVVTHKLAFARERNLYHHQQSLCDIVQEILLTCCSYRLSICSIFPLEMTLKGAEVSKYVMAPVVVFKKHHINIYGRISIFWRNILVPLLSNSLAWLNILKFFWIQIGFQWNEEVMICPMG